MGISKVLVSYFSIKFCVHFEELYILIIQLYANWPLRDYFYGLVLFLLDSYQKQERHVCVKAIYRPRENIS